MVTMEPEKGDQVVVGNELRSLSCSTKFVDHAGHPNIAFVPANEILRLGGGSTLTVADVKLTGNALAFASATSRGTGVPEKPNVTAPALLEAGWNITFSNSIDPAGNVVSTGKASTSPNRPSAV